MLLEEKVEKVRKKIRTIRLKKEYTQDYVGDRLGINQRSYHRLENGKTELKLKILFKLAIILEVEINYFLDIES